MKATFKLPNGSLVEAELTFEQFKELVGTMNGHAPRPAPSLPSSAFKTASTADTDLFFLADYDAFKKKITPKAKQFLAILRQNPNGISADHLAERLGFNAPVQIGGMAGGGMKKWANRFHVDLEDLYVREIRFENGDRRVVYKPGKNIEQVV